MHAKSDSEVTSLPGSSPPRSPRHHGILLRPPAYYVQSPSRDSHDGGDSKLSFQSTPLLSPVGSPLHPLATASATSDTRSSTSSLPPVAVTRKHQHHSRARVQPQPAGGTSPTSVTTSSNHSHSMSDAYNKKLLPSTIYEDEEEYGRTASKSSSTAAQIYTILFVILSCVAFLFLFILMFWLICRPSSPVLSIKNIVFHNLYVGQGTDASGVPSMLLTVNSTVHLDYENRSRYFVAHLDPLSVDFRYSVLSVASTKMDGYVQGKSSRKVIPIGVRALKVPLYGASTISSATKPSVPVTAMVSVCSRYYIVGQMVKSKFCTSIVCNLDVSSSSMALLTSVKKACIYDPPLL
ncbi:hypothetical protein GOP47_0016142 [Adiantum capillus-veneris]|uniref:Late embryogenesis abundant protein LEA-2 subgroup domain-containing protein n=1 Tax=Adiantum capillus-veneris TaxID=13818 RepID=A0A9D4ZBK0_ADICA|nr:hypothetical protein GOP47_0015819 [Adiantum capillus-veneris]KAI5069841.1 hypothetical protein GOP47_0016142 [Adiantum capillus-veneris]